MDSFEVWHAEFEREVEEVLESLRAGKLGGGAPWGAAQAVFSPPAPSQELAQAKAHIAELEPLVQDLRKRLEERSAQLSRELRRRGRIRAVVLKLKRSLEDLNRELARARLRAEEESRRAEALSAQLDLGARIRGQLAQELEAEKKEISRWAVEERELQRRVASLQEVLGQKERAFQELRQTHDEALRRFEEAAGERENRVRLLAAELERGKEELARLSGLLAAKEAAAEFFRREARAERERIVEERDALRSRLERTLSELKAERAASSERLKAALAQARDSAAGAEELRRRAEAAGREILRLQDEMSARALEHRKAVEDERSRLDAQSAADMSQAQAVRREGEAALAKAKDMEREASLQSERLKKERRAEQERLQRDLAEARRKAEEFRHKAEESAKAAARAASHHDARRERLERLLRIEQEKSRVHAAREAVTLRGVLRRWLSGLGL